MEIDNLVVITVLLKHVKGKLEYSTEFEKLGKKENDSTNLGGNPLYRNIGFLGNPKNNFH